MTDRFLYLAEIVGRHLESGVERTFRFATGEGFTTGPSDSPAHTTYEAVLEQAVDVTRTIFAPGTTDGQSKIGFGDLVLLNPDSDLDELLQYALDGRDVLVLRGLQSATLRSEFTPVFVGTMEQPEYDADRITIKLRDRQAMLQVPLQATNYGGTNVLPDGLDGVVSDLAGKPKPLVFGRALNIAPPCVNTARLIYQVNDGAVSDIPAVYDRGIALTAGGTYASEAELLNDALAPAAGAFKVLLSGGYVRLGSRPVGTVTADVTQGATAADRTAASIYRALLLRMAVDVGDIDADDLAALDARTDAELGLFVDGDMRASDAIDMVANSVGAWWGVSIDGVFRIKRLGRPTGSTVATFTENDLIGPPERISTADPERGVPAYRVTVRYAQNYTVQSDLAAGVDDARRTRLAEAWREVVESDASVQTRHRLATALVIESCFAFEDDARTEALRRLRLRSILRHRFDIVVDYTTETSAIDLGDVVGLLHPRFGLNVIGDEVGMKFVVIGVAPDARASVLRLSLWGNSFTTFSLGTDTGDYLGTDDGAYLVTDTR